MFEDLKKTPKENIGKIISVFCEDKFIGMYKVMNSGEMFAKAEFVMSDFARENTQSKLEKSERGREQQEIKG